MSSTRLRKLKKGFVLNAYKVSWFVRMKYSLRSTICISRRAKSSELITILLEENLNSIEFKGILEKEKMSSEIQFNC